MWRFFGAVTTELLPHLPGQLVRGRPATPARLTLPEATPPSVSGSPAPTTSACTARPGRRRSWRGSPTAGCPEPPTASSSSTLPRPRREAAGRASRRHPLPGPALPEPGPGRLFVGEPGAADPVPIYGAGRGPSPRPLPLCRGGRPRSTPARRWPSKVRPTPCTAQPARCAAIDHRHVAVREYLRAHPAAPAPPTGGHPRATADQAGAARSDPVGGCTPTWRTRREHTDQAPHGSSIATKEYRRFVTGRRRAPRESYMVLCFGPAQESASSCPPAPPLGQRRVGCWSSGPRSDA